MPTTHGREESYANAWPLVVGHKLGTADAVLCISAFEFTVSFKNAIMFVQCMSMNASRC